ncbi:hypothetical protein KIW84_042805 [Lathyrus oleraceus]|uniref:Uncharacterized protein n=1 Tax=Pisum sativum TaxID=3888 RepID=A0A9D4XBY9_PEA|nr:hypothetical protein KIW84_042805 [Pisum sativum]
MVSFEDCAPNMEANPLPTHGNSSINMVDGCRREYKVYDVHHIRQYLVAIHRDICLVSDYEHDHDGCFKTPERVVIQFDSSSNNNINKSVSPLVIRLAGSVPDASDRAFPYQYNATMVENGQGVSLPTTNSVVNIANVSKESGVSSKLNPNDDDEVLRLIKKSEFNVVEQLLQTALKISVLSLLMNSEAYREALQRILEKAYVEHDVTVHQFDHIVANITSWNNLSFCDEELPEEGRNHNLALHISMSCKEDALSNVLIDTGSSLNVLQKSTLSRISYQGAPMRYSGVIVKAFDGSHKTVIGEVDLLVKIGYGSMRLEL